MVTVVLIVILLLFLSSLLFIIYIILLLSSNYQGGRSGYKKLFTDSRCSHKSNSMYIDASPQFHLMYSLSFLLL